MPSSRWRLLVVFVAVVFFAAPAGLRLVGVHGRAFENRRLAAAPRLTDGFRAFDEATRYFIDQLPLRQQAVRANTWVQLHIFGNTPRYGQGQLAVDQALPFGAPRQGAAQPSVGRGAGQPSTGVIVGRNGWLFLHQDFDLACPEVVRKTFRGSFVPYAEALARWSRLLAVVRGSGRGAILVVVPDKSVVFPEYVPTNFDGKQCGQAGQGQLLNLLDLAPPAGVISLYHPLLRAKKLSRAPIYLPLDTHWNTLGALTLVQQTLPRLDSRVRVRPADIVQQPPHHYTGDLTTLLGAPTTGVTPSLTLRPASSGPQVPGHTLYIGDSFRAQALPNLRPYLKRLAVLQWYHDSEEQMTRAICGADNVIFETVARDFDSLASDTGTLGQVPYVNPRWFAHLKCGSPSTITSVAPAKGSIGVPTTTDIHAVFNGAMDPATTSHAFSIKRTSDGAPVAGSVAFFGERVPVFRPRNRLRGRTRYTVTLSTAATDVSGQHLATAETWQFTTR